MPEPARHCNPDRRSRATGETPPREPGDRAAEPFEIIETMADEVSEDPAAIIAPRLPALEAQPRRLVFDIPVYDHVPQPPDSRRCENCACALPGRKLGKVEVDHPRHAGGSGHARASIWPRRDRRPGAFRQRSACRDRGREPRFRAADPADGNRDRVDRRVIDQGAPVTDAARNTGRAREFSCPAASEPASATTSQRGSVRNAGRTTVRP